MLKKKPAAPNKTLTIDVNRFNRFFGGKFDPDPDGDLNDESAEIFRIFFAGKHGKNAAQMKHPVVNFHLPDAPSELLPELERAVAACDWNLVHIISAALAANAKIWKPTDGSAKKAAAKKTPVKKAAAKKAGSAKKPAKAAKPVPAKKKKPVSQWMKPLYPSPLLAKVVGTQAQSRTEMTKRVWIYIKKHKLQDKKNLRMINCDAALEALYGRKSISMFEMTKATTAHLSSKPFPLLPPKPAAKQPVAKAAKKLTPTTAVITPRITPLIYPDKPAAAKPKAADAKALLKREACLRDLDTAIKIYGADVTRKQFAAIEPASGRSFETAFGSWDEFKAERINISKISMKDALVTRNPLLFPEPNGVSYPNTAAHADDEMQFKCGQWSFRMAALEVDGPPGWIISSATHMPYYEFESGGFAISGMRRQSRESALQWIALNELRYLEKCEKDRSAEHQFTSEQQEAIKKFRDWLTGFIKQPAEKLAEYNQAHKNKSAIPPPKETMGPEVDDKTIDMFHNPNQERARA